MSNQTGSSRCCCALLVKGAAGIVALAGLAASASAYTIDFESMPNGYLPSYSEGGATIYASDGTSPVTATEYGLTPNGTRGVIAGQNGDGNFPSLIAYFATAMTDVSVDLGDFNSDRDSIYLLAYDTGGNLLAADGFALDEDFTGMHTLSVSAVDIAYVVFGGDGVQGSSVYADNLTFVPAPGAAAFLSIGGLLAARRRRA